MSLSPITADAQDFPNGQVQFTATGYYMTAPLTVNAISAKWGTCDQQLMQPTTEVSVTANGLAQCASGAKGTFTIWANNPIQVPGTYSCTAETACGGGCVIQATSQLTCP
jgi:hypothetical protein